MSHIMLWKQDNAITVQNPIVQSLLDYNFKASKMVK